MLYPSNSGHLQGTSDHKWICTPPQTQLPPDPETGHRDSQVQQVVLGDQALTTSGGPF